MPRPKVNQETQNKLDQADEKFQETKKENAKTFQENFQNREVPDYEPQTKLSQNEMEKFKDIYLKPINFIASRDRFNERFRKDWEYDKQYVKFICEHKESPGDIVEVWTKPYGGLSAEFWRVPTNRPVVGPRHLAEQLRGRIYHKYVMSGDKEVERRGNEQIQFFEEYGSMAISKVEKRITAEPVLEQKSVFMPFKGE